jgi:hypothetical protein
MSFKRRIERLERQKRDAANIEPCRVVISACGRPLNLANSTCKRTLCENGALMEVVHFDGRRAGLTDEALDRFVESFPVHISNGRNR